MGCSVGGCSKPRGGRNAYCWMHLKRRVRVARAVRQFQDEMLNEDLDLPIQDRAPRPAVAHGTRARYRQGCHCGGCRAANAEYQRGYYQVRKALTLILS